MMDARLVFGFGLIVTLLATGGATAERAGAVPVSAIFTYQGQLLDGGAPANGAFDLRFTLYDTNVGGAQVGPTFDEDNVPVRDGLFTVVIGFGTDIFTGEARWLEIGVRPRASSGGDPYTTLTPRQNLTATPYALYAPAAGTANSANDLVCSACVSSPEISAGAVDGTKILDGTILGADIADSTVPASKLTFTPGTVTSITAGAGLTGGTITNTGTIAANIGTTAGSVAAGNHTHNAWGLDGNNTGAGDFLGTLNSQPLDFRVNNTRALRLERAGVSVNVIGGFSANSVTSGAIGATIGGGGVAAPGNNQVTDDFGTVGGGVGNQAGDGTAADRPNATVGGGTSNTASGTASTVSGGEENAGSGSYATVGGGQSNQAKANYATIAGGGRRLTGDAGTANRVTDNYGTVGGGGDNQAGDADANLTDAAYATVGGGSRNSASAANSTVSGGQNNTASGITSTVAGGHSNSALSLNATVGGGSGNTVGVPGGGEGQTVSGGTSNEALGPYSTVPGGRSNSALGDYSFAAGRLAKANDDGSFVWADNHEFDFASGNPNTFRVRATGGARFVSAINPDTGAATAGVRLVSGGGSWEDLSDRNAKANFAPVDGRDIVARLATIPMQTWNYKSQDASVRHIGPMAQDLYATFHVGADDTHISTVDADGVALAAIQGLYEVMQEKDEQIATLQKQNGALEARLTALERRVQQSLGIAATGTR